MDKITSILALVEDSATDAVVLDKAATLARALGAHVDQQGGLPAARGRRPDLLIKAPADAQSDLRLAEELSIPILLAGARPWAEPLRLAAAVDVSSTAAELAARAVLQAAGFLALGLHGRLDILYSEREARDETVRMGRAVKLAQLVREFHVGSERLQMFAGEPGERLPPLIAARQYDLLVVDTRAHALAEATTGDVLLVQPALAHARVRAAPLSVRHQGADHREQFV